jgi:peroxiredoxin
MTVPSRCRALVLCLAFAAGGAAAATPGAAAPDFAVSDSHGKPVKLSDYRGKFVVLEWTNPECPFVRAQYGAATMQALQKEAAGKDVVWLSVNSTNESSSEFKSGAQMNAWIKEKDAAPKAVLIDATSATGRAYGAKTTPHMFVIDPKGTIVYAGAIDDKRSARESDRRTANNYVRAALSESLAGKPVTVASTQPYGCSVKY